MDHIHFGARAGGALFRPAARWPHIVDMFLTWSERAAQRRMLAGLDDRLLKDVGLSRADVAHEAGKRFWQV